MEVQFNGLGDAEAAVGDSELLRRAYSVALKAHEGQVRRGSREPYVTHPLAVAKRLREEGFDDETLAAAILHDAVEHSEVSLEQIVRDFGRRIAELVAALTEDPTIDDWGARKRALREHVCAAGPEAIAIYTADKLTNVGDTRVLYAREGERSGRRFDVSLGERIAVWKDDLETVSRVGGNARMVADLRAALAALEQDRARVLQRSPTAH